jgi:glycosyltransferase involved in cell wall biosynthesis
MDSVVSGQPTISVLLNVWRGDRIDLLIESIRSVHAQTNPLKKFLIVSDGPLLLEQKAAITNLEADSPVPQILLETPETFGLWNARNIGLQNLDTKYVAVHDADDVMHPDRLKMQVEFLSKFPVDVLGSAMFEINSKSKLVKAARSVLESDDQIKSALGSRNPINHPSVVFDRERVLQAGGYRNVHFAEDYELWSRLSGLNYTFANLPFALVGFHVDPTTYARRGGYAFINGERKLRKELLLNGSTTRIKSMFVAAVRVVYHIMPSKFRSVVHILVLNQKLRTGFPISESEFMATPPINVRSSIKILK